MIHTFTAKRIIGQFLVTHVKVMMDDKHFRFEFGKAYDLQLEKGMHTIEVFLDYPIFKKKSGVALATFEVQDKPIHILYQSPLFVQMSGKITFK